MYHKAKIDRCTYAIVEGRLEKLTYMKKTNQIVPIRCGFDTVSLRVASYFTTRQSWPRGP